MIVKDANFAQGKLTNKLKFCVTDVGTDVAPGIDASLEEITLPDLNLTFPSVTGSSATFNVILGQPNHIVFNLYDPSDQG